MGRFDRDNNRPTSNSEALATATERLRMTVERQISEVVEEARAQALAIEDRALAKASQVEKESQRKADEIFQESRESASHVLDSSIHRAQAMSQATETLQAELARVIGSFRVEIDSVAAELTAAKQNLLPSPAEPAPHQLESHSAVTPEAPPPAPPEPNDQPQPVAEPEPATPSPMLHASAIGDNLARDMIRQQLLRLRDTGEPRVEAERYLERFKQSGEYRQILDEIYAPDEPVKQRRGLFRRRR